MPLIAPRRFVGREQTQITTRQLARYLAFVAGAVNAGGFFALRQYTSHVTGIVSAMAENLAIGRMQLVATGGAAALAFLLGAMFTTLIVYWARGRALKSELAFPLIAEAMLLILFGLAGRLFPGRDFLATISLLSFTMGLQNAILTKVSGTVVRTTHLTGIVTDVGIKLGRMAYAKFTGRPLLGDVELEQLQLLTSLVGLFLAGGLVGVRGFTLIGFLFTLPLALFLLLLAARLILDDWVRRSAIRRLL